LGQKSIASKMIRDDNLVPPSVTVKQWHKRCTFEIHYLQHYLFGQRSIAAKMVREDKPVPWTPYDAPGSSHRKCQHLAP